MRADTLLRRFTAAVAAFFFLLFSPLPMMLTRHYALPLILRLLPCAALRLR